MKSLLAIALTLAFAGAEDVNQRRGNAYLTRTSYTSAVAAAKDGIAVRVAAVCAIIRVHGGMRARADIIWALTVVAAPIIDLTRRNLGAVTKLSSAVP